MELHHQYSLTEMFFFSTLFCFFAYDRLRRLCHIHYLVRLEGRYYSLYSLFSTHPPCLVRCSVPRRNYTMSVSIYELTAHTLQVPFGGFLLTRRGRVMLDQPHLNKCAISGKLSSGWSWYGKNMRYSVLLSLPRSADAVNPFSFCLFPFVVGFETIFCLVQVSASLYPVKETATSRSF